MQKFKIVWIGFHLEGLLAFTAIAKKYNIVAAFGLRDDAAAKRSAVADYKRLCKIYKVSYYEVSQINDDDSVKLVKDLRPDLLIVLGWSQILSKKVLSIPKIGTIGAHASLLPSYRGSAPVNWALINGLNKTGNTLMWLDEGVDTGMIIDQMEIIISKFDSCKTIYQKVARTNKIMLLRNLDSIIQKGKYGTLQFQTDEPILPRRKPSDGLIHFDQKVDKIYDFIRALTKPYPGAFFVYHNEKCIVWGASPIISLKHSLAAGIVIDHVFSFSPVHCGIIVSAKEGGIFIYDIEASGKRLKGKKIHNKFPIGSNLNKLHE
jgi:methionyl-tRNA formyltransferase